MFKKIDGNWRLEQGIACKIVYKKKFAFIPVKLEADGFIWCKHYYRRQEIYNSKDWNEIYFSGNHRGHPEKPTYISEEEYLIRILAEGQ